MTDSLSGVQLKRAYQPPSPGDGERYLVERLWPRGVAKESLQLSGWLKDLAPSTELRRWYGHDTRRWPEFCHRYREELRDPEKQGLLSDLARKARGAKVTLVFGTKDEEHSGAHVLREVLAELLAGTHA